MNRCRGRTAIVALVLSVFSFDAMSRAKGNRPAGQPTGCAGAKDAAATKPSTRPTSRATSRRASTMPDASFEDLALIVQTARRSFRDKVLKRPERGPSYRPPLLRGTRAILHMTLRSDGRLLAEVETPEMDVIDAAVAAGALLGQSVLDKAPLMEQPGVRSGGDRLGIEIEWIGPPEYLSAKYVDGVVWADELLHGFEGGREGIGVEFAGRIGRTRPSTVIVRNYTPDLALFAAEDKVGLSTLDKQNRARDIRYFRFPVYHLWQPSARALPIRLTRGERLLSADVVTAEGLDAAIGRLAAYLRYRQNRSGWFAHQFAPSSDRYLQTDSATAQMHALQVMTQYAVWAKRADFLADAMRGLRAVMPRLMEARHRSEVGPDGSPTSRPTSAPADPARLVLHFQGRGHYLEVSSRLLSALVALESAPDPIVGPSEAPEFDAERRGLVETLLKSQDSDGRLRLVLGEEQEQASGDNAAAGRAILALAESAGRRPDRRIEVLLHRALPYYRKKLAISGEAGMTREAGAPAAASLIRGFAAGYPLTNDAETSDFVFELLDQLARLQLNESNCPWPELWGAINVRRLGAVGADTAWYLTALADGAALADRVGDRDRARRYRAAVRAASRFIVQLEFSRAGCFFVRSPGDVLGGVRSAVWDNQIRVDHCASALAGLIRAREILFGK